MGEKLGRYEIIETIGSGSMGTVYKARDPLIGRMLAIKSINLLSMPDQAERDRYKTRFLQEAKAAGALNHPNLVTIHDMGETEDTAYLAMEFMEGKDLEHADRPDLDEALNIAIQVADGLNYAHEHGIVHRDIKPANIMLLKDQHVKICDFGIAKIVSPLLYTKVGTILGSPLYMSPEQVLGKPLDNRSDIFSLGIVLYEMVTGEAPFTGMNSTEVMSAIVNTEAQKPSTIKPELPEMLDAILAKCLAKKPADRYSNAGELEADLRVCRGKVLQAQTGEEHHKHFYQSASSGKRRLSAGKVITFVILVALAAIGIYELVKKLG